ncbi:MAG: hypothetical protein J3K34DRAFT_520769 [Monoraphidium minutum]|nr:MAG: hypothetical protein J3K34DRAFT_520769 [Monoraphidium minutum]
MDDGGGYSDGEDMPYAALELGGGAAGRSPAPQAFGADAAGAGGGDGQPEKKRRRRKRKLDAPTVAHFMRLQQGRGPVRKWTRKWVAVPSILGGSDVMMLKWVTDQPMAVAAGPSLEQLNEMDVLPSFDDLSAGAAVPGGGTPSAGAPPPGHAPPGDAPADAAPAAAGAPQRQQEPQQQQQQPKQEPDGTPGPGGARAAAAEGGPQGGIRGAVAAMAAAAAAAAAAKAAPAAASGGAGAAAGKFVCQQCGKAVNSEGGLKKHMLIHGEKNFLCTHPGCGKSFTDQGKLNKHMVVHETEKRWPCPLCSKPFVGEAYLKSHWKKSHRDVPMPGFVESQPAAGGGGGGAPG